MNKKYAVLNNKLFPEDVAKLLLVEGVGDFPVSVQVKIIPKEAPDFSHLESLLIKAAREKIDHPFTILSITEMLLKLIKNNNNKSEVIMVKILKGEKTFLYMYFME